MEVCPLSGKPCKKPKRHQITETINGDAQSFYLCEECASSFFVDEEIGVNPQLRAAFLYEGTGFLGCGIARRITVGGGGGKTDVRITQINQHDMIIPTLGGFQGDMPVRHPAKRLDFHGLGNKRIRQQHYEHCQNASFIQYGSRHRNTP